MKQRVIFGLMVFGFYMVGSILVRNLPSQAVIAFGLAVLLFAVTYLIMQNSAKK